MLQCWKGCPLWPPARAHNELAPEILDRQALCRRLPELVRKFYVTGRSAKIASPFGGLIYITLPAGLSLGRLDVQMSGEDRSP